MLFQKIRRKKSTGFLVAYMCASFFGASLSCEGTRIISLQNEENIFPGKLENIKCALFEEDYEEVLDLVKKGLGKSFSLDDLISFAKSIKHDAFEAAACATKNFVESPKENKDRLRIGLAKADFFKMAFFIENDLLRSMQKDEFLFTTKKTGLLCPIECDRKSGKVFIVLDEFKNSYLGEGMMKVVNKAIMYDRKSPQFVARAVQLRLNENEKYMLEHAKGSKGVYKVIGSTVQKINGKVRHIIYSKLYRSGTINDSLKSEKFSLREKAKMFHELLRGLETLHKRKIAHLDIKQNNCFIDIDDKKAKKREITAVLADFGRSRKVHFNAVVGKYAQGNRFYNPPEAMYKERLDGEDFLATDVYALGCVFYHIFHDKMPAWQKLDYYPKAEHASCDFRYYVLANKIKGTIESRFQSLREKRQSDKITAKEAMEYLILKMVSVNPKRRSTAHKLRVDMEKIIQKL